MEHYGLSKYSVGVLVLYGAMAPFLFILYPESWNYTADLESLNRTILLSVGGILLLYCLNRSFGWITLKRRPASLKQSIVILLFAFAIAVPEEIIFRGIIQTHLYAITANASAAVLLSSLVFGLAHLPNGSRGTHPSKWNWRFAAVAFCGGLMFGSLFAMTGSLFYPTILHAAVLIFFGFYLKK